MDRMADLEARLHAGVAALERQFLALNTRIDHVLGTERPAQEAGADYGGDELSVAGRLIRATEVGSVPPEFGALIQEALQSPTSSDRVAAARALVLLDPVQAAAELPMLVDRETNRRARGILAELLEEVARS